MTKNATAMTETEANHLAHSLNQDDNSSYYVAVTGVSTEGLTVGFTKSLTAERDFGGVAWYVASYDNANNFEGLI